MVHAESLTFSSRQIGVLCGGVYMWSSMEPEGAAGSTPTAVGLYVTLHQHNRFV